MSDSEYQPPPYKKCKLALANNATKARAAKKSKNMDRVKNAHKARHIQNDTGITAAREIKQQKQAQKHQNKENRKYGRQKQNQQAKSVRNAQLMCFNDIKTLITNLNHKLDEYLQLNTIDASILYVNIF